MNKTFAFRRAADVSIAILISVLLVACGASYQASPTIEGTEARIEITPANADIELTDIRPLKFDGTTPSGHELRALLNRPPDWSYEGDGPFNLLGWTATGELLVQPVIPNTRRPERPVWSINIDNGQATPLPNWNIEPSLLITHQQVISDFLSHWQGEPELVRWYPAPTGKYLALKAMGGDEKENMFYVYHVGQAKEPIILPEPGADGLYKATSIPPVWSPVGNKLAYGVVIYKTAGYPPESHKLYISDMDTGEQLVITPVYYKGYPKVITWSPDGRYIAFSGQRGEHDSIDLFVVKADGTDLINLTPDAKYGSLDLLFWSPVGNYIAYGDYGSATIQLAKINIK